MRTRFQGIFFLVLYGALCASCAHGTAPHQYDTSHPVHVPLARNETLSTSLEFPLTSAVKNRLARIGVHVVGEDADALQLVLHIVAVNARPGMVGINQSQPVGMDNVLHIAVEASLTEKDGDVLIDPERIETKDPILVGAGARTESTHGRIFRQELLDELAEAIVTRFFRKEN